MKYLLVAVCAIILGTIVGVMDHFEFVIEHPYFYFLGFVSGTITNLVANS